MGHFNIQFILWWRIYCKHTARESHLISAVVIYTCIKDFIYRVFCMLLLYLDKLCYICFHILVQILFLLYSNKNLTEVLTLTYLAFVCGSSIKKAQSSRIEIFS